PQFVAITPDGATAYVTNGAAGTVTPIALPSNTAGTPITVGANPRGIAITGTPGVPPFSDLALATTASAPSAAAGGNLTYTLTATNNGPNVATGVTLTDTLPANAGFVSATPSQGTCAQTAGVVTCTLSGLAVGGSATVTIVVTPSPGA